MLHLIKAALKMLFNVFLIAHNTVGFNELLTSPTSKDHISYLIPVIFQDVVSITLQLLAIYYS